MKPIELISQDLFDKVRSRFKNLEMGDETGAVTINPAEARFFDFDFVVEGNQIGRISISINDQGGLKIFYSQGITEDLDDTSKQLWYNFLKEMRMFAKRRLLRFDTRDISKNNLERKDFQYLAKKGAGDKEMPTMNESKWNSKNTKKTSRAVRGRTEVIVRHNKTVDETYPGSRSQRKNIKAIFIQNKEGERFKYPFIHPAGAFAMAQHVDHGGIPHDPAGKAIIRMSEQIAQLQEFQRHVQRSNLHDDAMGIISNAHGKLMELRSMIEALSKRKNYEAWIENFDSMIVDENLPELDQVTIEEYKSKFTQSNFKEELMQFFPLIHRIMQETNAVNLDEYINETEICDQCHKDPCECDEQVDEVKDDFVQFENWANFVENDESELTDDQIKDLKKALETLSTPLEFETAMRFFNEYGIDDEDLENRLEQDGKAADDADDETADPMNTFIAWAQETNPELISKLGIKIQPPQPEMTQPVQGQAPAVENTEMQMSPGTMESKDYKSMIKKVAGICRQYYNGDNPNVGPFRGEEGILIEVEKQIAEEFGEEAAQEARELAMKFMEKLTNEWQERHGKSEGIANDGLARLKELANLIKTKVEGIGDRGEGGEDFNVNIMPAQESEINLEEMDVIRKLSGLNK